MKYLLMIVSAVNIFSLGQGATIPPSFASMYEGHITTIPPFYQPAPEASMSPLIELINTTAEAAMLPWTNATEAGNPFGVICPSLDQANACLHDAMGEFYNVILNPFFLRNPQSAQLTFCKINDLYKNCSAPQLQGCSPISTVTLDIFENAFDILCSPLGFKDFVSLLPCLSNISIAYELNYCAVSIPVFALKSELCRLPDYYTACAARAANSICSIEAGNSIQSLLRQILAPYREAVCSYTSESPSQSPSVGNVSTTSNATQTVGATNTAAEENTIVVKETTTVAVEDTTTPAEADTTTPAVEDTTTPAEADTTTPAVED
ncbi:unnamed protein product, partial [Lymnaea stagnalis]